MCPGFNLGYDQVFRNFCPNLVKEDDNSASASKTDYVNLSVLNKMHICNIYCPA